MICHYGVMPSCRTEDWDIILLPDPQGTVGNLGSHALGRLHGRGHEVHRVYAFVQPGMRLGRRGRIRLEALAGPVIYRLGDGKVRRAGAVAAVAVIAGRSTRTGRG